MTIRKAWRNRLAILGGSTFLYLAPTALPPPAIAAAGVTDANVAEKNAEATTKADHDALAAYFKEKAAEAGRTAESHERMAEVVKAGGGLKGQTGMEWHCRDLVRSSRNLQEAYEDLAAEHARMASEAAR